ncbi:MAG: hypothetical protein EXR71_19315 [Myxococcales bacterium]|nr:hypothetical protein [Myxococcales bacterium]
MAACNVSWSWRSSPRVVRRPTASAPSGRARWAWTRRSAVPSPWCSGRRSLSRSAPSAPPSGSPTPPTSMPPSTPPPPRCSRSPRSTWARPNSSSRRRARARG